MIVTPLTIAHLASEMAPLAKVGGLGDVVGSLAAEQARRGHRVVVALPRYRTIEIPSGWRHYPVGKCRVPWGMGREPASFELLEPPQLGPRVLLISHDGERHFFDRPGIYDDPSSGEGFRDNGERFLFFARAALEALKGFGERLDVIHAHDHQAAWAPCFVRTHDADEPLFAGVATVFTLHNLGYQGIHDAWVLGLAGFGRELFYPQSPFEFFGRVNFMKVGLGFADLISTVSPTYAREIQTSGEYGFGLEGVLRRRGADLRGILNGIDDQAWDPARDPYLPERYDRDQLAGKATCRDQLVRHCGFAPSPDLPILGMVSRLAEQKGFDLIEQAEEELLRLAARFVVLGVGQPRYQALLERLGEQHPRRFHYDASHDEGLAHLIEAGSDLFLMPSRYEPCGLNQMYSLRYGTVPVVRGTGGLADTVQEFDPVSRQGNGFVFDAFEPGEMLMALRRALAVQRQPELWRACQRNGMGRDFSWRASADGYDRLYTEARARVSSGRVPTLDTVRASH